MDTMSDKSKRFHTLDTPRCKNPQTGQFLIARFGANLAYAYEELLPVRQSVRSGRFEKPAEGFLH